MEESLGWPGSFATPTFRSKAFGRRIAEPLDGHFTLSSIAADNSWSRAAMPSFKNRALSIP
jgi:hypothetical protein